MLDDGQCFFKVKSTSYEKCCDWRHFMGIAKISSHTWLRQDKEKEKDSHYQHPKNIVIDRAGFSLLSNITRKFCFAVIAFLCTDVKTNPGT